jgi:hypothetical protein
MTPITFGEIVRRTGKPAHRVSYVLKSRGIQPIARAGQYRLFGEDVPGIVEAECQKIDGRKA